MKYKQREIVLVPFPYSDLTSTKKRPVLVISNNEYNSKLNDVVVCVITSNTNLDEYSILLDNTDLEIGVLPEISAIKVHKLFTIDKTKIIKKFSKINRECFDKVTKKLNKLINDDDK